MITAINYMEWLILNQITRHTIVSVIAFCSVILSEQPDSTLITTNAKRFEMMCSYSKIQGFYF